MNRHLASGLVLAAAGFLAVGCAAGPGHTRAAGTIGGTAAGAAIGGATGGRSGALAGGILGLVAGTIAGEGIAQDQERAMYGPPPPPPPPPREVTREPPTPPTPRGSAAGWGSARSGPCRPRPW